ncbi:MAG TPA: NUDIX domain-containing protein [Longimicrobium sp.]|jgi:mutator protein MutT
MSIRVVAAVIEQGGRYLVCLRPHGKRHGGLWEFPGGKVKGGESTSQAVARELAEELAVAVTFTGRVLFARADLGSEFVIEFVETEIRGSPVLLAHDQLVWCHPEELLQLPLAPSDRDFVLEHLTQG